MRLPTLSPRQKKIEDARALHERLYDGYLNDRDVVLPCEVGRAGLLARDLSWSLHRFWYDRGYTLHAQKFQDNCRVRVWLTKWTEEPKGPKVKPEQAA